MLLYHRRLRSLVAIELKTDKFRPEHAGKMNFYLTALNEKMKYEYALKDNNQPIGVGTYIIKEELPIELQKYLPSQEALINSIESFEDGFAQS